MLQLPSTFVGIQRDVSWRGEHSLSQDRPIMFNKKSSKLIFTHNTFVQELYNLLHI